MSVTQTTLRPAPAASRVPMSQVSISVVILIAFGGIVAGIAIGVATHNFYFCLVMAGLPLVAIFLFGIFVPTDEPTRPAQGSASPALPIVALVLSCVGTSVVGIALGHASRHLIKQRGGEGEAIALAALIVGYSLLAVEIAFGLWLLTFLISLPAT